MSKQAIERKALSYRSRRFRWNLFVPFVGQQRESDFVFTFIYIYIFVNSETLYFHWVKRKN